MSSQQTSPIRSRPSKRTIAFWGIGIAAAALVWQMATSSGGVPDPTDPSAHLSHGAVVFDSGLLVFREGLETILVLAAVLASFLGANRALRGPVAAGGATGFAGSAATWFIAIGVLGALGARGLDVQAATGLLAVIVLLVVMNWFFHRIYWTAWISNHHRRRKRLLDQSHGEAARKGVLFGLVLLGFTSVYREGFEVVLFLQNLRLQYGSSTVLEGVAIGLGLTAVVGIVTFALHHRLPYKRLLVVTGVMLGVVLVVMVGESVQEMQLAGWLPTTTLDIAIPGWLGLWFAIFPTVEGIAAQLMAAGLVIGSYLVAVELKVRRPRRRGQVAAQRAEAPPAPALSGP
jgi:high-affinity iron transporter